MKAIVEVRCYMCGKKLGKATADTADLPEQIQDKLNALILAHRKDCKYYSREGWKALSTL